VTCTGVTVVGPFKWQRCDCFIRIGNEEADTKTGFCVFVEFTINRSAIMKARVSKEFCDLARNSLNSFGFLDILLSLRVVRAGIYGIIRRLNLCTQHLQKMSTDLRFNPLRSRLFCDSRGLVWADAFGLKLLPLKFQNLLVDQPLSPCWLRLHFWGSTFFCSFG